jgi:hypothetical protein
VRFAFSDRLSDDSLWCGPSPGVPCAERFNRDAKSSCALRLGQAKSRSNLPQRRCGASHRSRRCHWFAPTESEWIAMRMRGSRPLRNGPETAKSISVGRFRPVASRGGLSPKVRGANPRFREFWPELARPAGLEPATPGLEEQWRDSEAPFFSGGCGATHASYPRGHQHLLQSALHEQFRRLASDAE